jgi:hypothetical protein
LPANKIRETQRKKEKRKIPMDLELLLTYFTNHNREHEPLPSIPLAVNEIGTVCRAAGAGWSQPLKEGPLIGVRGEGVRLVVFMCAKEARFYGYKRQNKNQRHRMKQRE